MRRSLHGDRDFELVQAEVECSCRNEQLAEGGADRWIDLKEVGAG